MSTRGPGIVDSHWILPSAKALSRPRDAVTSATPPPEEDDWRALIRDVEETDDDDCAEALAVIGATDRY